jgi:hypothetical protein
MYAKGRYDPFAELARTATCCRLAASADFLQSGPASVGSCLPPVRFGRRHWSDHHRQARGGGNAEHRKKMRRRIVRECRVLRRWLIGHILKT